MIESDPLYKFSTRLSACVILLSDLSVLDQPLNNKSSGAEFFCLVMGTSQSESENKDVSS